MRGVIPAPRCAYAHNLLDNSDFRQPINLRGETSYNTNSMAINRWKVLSGTFIVNSGYISTGFFEQKIRAESYKGHYTLAAKRTDGNILAYSQPIENAYHSTEARPSFGAIDDGFVRVTFPAGEYVWAVLYEGIYTADTLPPYHPKGYMAELLACQRYYYPYKPSNTALSFAGWYYSTSAVRVALLLPVAMDISSSRVPTISLDTANVLILPEKKAPTSIQVTVVSPNMIMLTFGVTGTQHDLCAIRVNAPLVIIAPD